MPLPDDFGSAGRVKIADKLDRALNALDRPGFVFLLLAPFLLQWIVPLFRSRLWLDETVTWWTTNQGLRELVRRCTYWPGSILYNSLILLLRSLGAHREWVLRLPSLLGMILAAAILFDLAKKWFSVRTAIAAVVFFCAQSWVSFAAADARPYGLGVLAVVGSTWLLLRWLDTRQLRHACAYGVTAALMLHFHMLFATVLIFHGIFLAIAAPRDRRTWKQLAAAAGILICLTLPLLPQYAYAFTSRAAHTFSNPRTLWDLCRQFLPAVPMLASALIAAVLPKWRPAKRVAIPGRSILLAGLWAGVPLVLLFIAAKLSGSDLFVGRYALPYVPGISLSFGVVLEYLSTRLRTGLVLLIFAIPTAVSCAHGDFPSHSHSGDWAAAIEYIDGQNRAAPAEMALPAMMRSSFPESDFFQWQTANMDDSSIYSPLAYYRSRSKWYPLPATFSRNAAAAIGEVMSSQTGKGRQLFFATRDDGKLAAAYISYLRSKGDLEQLRNFEGILVFRFRW